MVSNEIWAPADCPTCALHDTSTSRMHITHHTSHIAYHAHQQHATSYIHITHHMTSHDIISTHEIDGLAIAAIEMDVLIHPPAEHNTCTYVSIIQTCGEDRSSITLHRIPSAHRIQLRPSHVIQAYMRGTTPSPHAYVHRLPRIFHHIGNHSLWEIAIIWCDNDHIFGFERDADETTPA